MNLSNDNTKAIFDTLDEAVDVKPVVQGNTKYYGLGYSVQAVVSMD